MDWPRSFGYLRQLAVELANPVGPTTTTFSPWLLIRGVVFTFLMLAHGFRRLLPTY